MMLGSLYVDVGSSRRVNGVTDRRTAFQLYIYRLGMLLKVFKVAGNEA